MAIPDTKPGTWSKKIFPGFYEFELDKNVFIVIKPDYDNKYQVIISYASNSGIRYIKADSVQDAQDQALKYAQEYLEAAIKDTKELLESQQISVEILTKILNNSFLKSLAKPEQIISVVPTDMTVTDKERALSLNNYISGKFTIVEDVIMYDIYQKNHQSRIKDLCERDLTVIKSYFPDVRTVLAEANLKSISFLVDYFIKGES